MTDLNIRLYEKDTGLFKEWIVIRNGLEFSNALGVSAYISSDGITWDKVIMNSSLFKNDYGFIESHNVDIYKSWLIANLSQDMLKELEK